MALLTSRAASLARKAITSATDSTLTHFEASARGMAARLARGLRLLYPPRPLHGLLPPRPQPPDLTRLHQPAILMQMRTTLNIDELLLREAQRLSGLKEKTAVLHAGLEALIAREGARRLAVLGGSERRLRPIPRRRPRRR